MSEKQKAQAKNHLNLSNGLSLELSATTALKRWLLILNPWFAGEALLLSAANTGGVSSCAIKIQIHNRYKVSVSHTPRIATGRSVKLSWRLLLWTQIFAHLEWGSFKARLSKIILNFFCCLPFPKTHRWDLNFNLNYLFQMRIIKSTIFCYTALECFYSLLMHLLSLEKGSPELFFSFMFCFLIHTNLPE